MKFGKQLALRVQPGWEMGYLDYRGLKLLLKNYTDSSGHENKERAAAVLERAVGEELTKVITFYNDKLSQGFKLKERAQSMIKQQQTNKQNQNEVAKILAQLGSEMESLIDFAILNEHGFTKILKKCEKKAPELTLSDKYLSRAKEAAFAASEKPRELLQWVNKELVGITPIIHRDSATPSLESLSLMSLQPEYPTLSSLDLDAIPIGTITRMWVALGHDGLAAPIRVPIIVAKGHRVGPVLGITAALHGNELNGIPLIHRLFREIKVEELSGTVVTVPVANPIGYLRQHRGYLENTDLNRLMPGKKDGSGAQQFAYNLMDRIIKHFQYLIDMHTASAGRINSLYVRANMINPITARMAILQNPQIIVHNTGPDGSLRSAAMDRGIHSITVEVGDPQRFHKRFINFALLGVENILCSLKMAPRQFEQPDFEPVVCTRSFWMFTKTGGILTVFPDINQWVREGQVVARVHNIFGEPMDEYTAPSDGIVVGKSVNPVCFSGDRILHLGVVTTGYERTAEDGHL